MSLRFCLFAAALAAFAVDARSATVTYTDTATFDDAYFSTDGWENREGWDVSGNQVLSVPKFDPALGTLVAVTAWSTFEGNYSYEILTSDQAANTFADMYHSHQPSWPLLPFTISVNTTYTAWHPSYLGTGSLHAFTQSGGTVTSASELSAFIGAPNAMFTTSVTGQVGISNEMLVDGETGWVHLDWEAELTVTYYYGSGNMDFVPPDPVEVISIDDRTVTINGDESYAMAALVPEPTGLGVLLAGGVAASSRRRR